MPCPPCRFTPSSHGLPADDYLHLAFDRPLQHIKDVLDWTQYELGQAIEIYGYKLSTWEQFTNLASAPLIARANITRNPDIHINVIWDPNDDEDGYLVLAGDNCTVELINLARNISDSTYEGPLSVQTKQSIAQHT